MPQSVRARVRAHVVLRFGDVDVNAGAVIPHEVAQRGQARVAQRERRVRADQAPEVRIGARRRQEPVVLGEAGVAPAQAAAVRHLVAEDAAHADDAERLADDVERPGMALGDA